MLRHPREFLPVPLPADDYLVHLELTPGKGMPRQLRRQTRAVRPALASGGCKLAVM
jgi:hypothetical protein